MSAWDELVKSALMGTERRAPALPEVEGPSGQLLTGLPDAGPEGRLLSAAAALALWMRAGKTLSPAPEAGEEPAPAETLPRCGAAAALHLELMLRGEYREALPEWLRAAAAARVRAPEALLPSLLQLGRSHTELRETLLPVLGQRGRWLAARSEQWAYVGCRDEDAADVWETGRHEERVRFLRRFRAENAEEGRALLESGWKSEAGERRADLLQALEVGLSPADEPFLEAALADRRKEARAVALDLLARLPESGVVRRMTERALARVTLRRVLLSERLEAALPDGLDEGMLQDGLEIKTAATTARMGDKAGWLAQMIGLVPPHVWEDRMRKTPRDLVRLARASEWAPPLLQGWALATQRHRNLPWAEALLLDEIEANPLEPTELANVLSPSRLIAVLRELGDGPGGDQRALSALRGYTGEWSEELSRMALQILKRHLARATAREYAVQGFIGRLGFALVPLPALETDEGWPVDAKEWRYWQHAVERMQATLRFRREMLAALKQADS